MPHRIELGSSDPFQRLVKLMDDKERPVVAAPSQRPRSPRVPVDFAVDVEGQDSSGQPFQVKAQATKISHGGASIAIENDVAVGSLIKLTPPFGRQLQAVVNGVWHDEMDGKRMIGVKLLSGDGWFAE